MAGDLSQISKTKIGESLVNGDITLLKKCLSNKENINWRDKRGNSFMHLLAGIYQPSLFHVMVSAGCDCNIQNKHGNTPLHNTVLAGVSFNVPLLLTAGADTSIKNKEGKLACELKTKNDTWKRLYDIYQPGLFECVDNHDITMFKRQLQKWCRYDAKRNGRTLRQYAAAKQYHDLVGIIDSHQYTLDCIYGVIELNESKVKEALTKSSCKVNYLNEGHGKRHILQYAINKNQSNLVSLLCKAGADVNIPISVRHYFRGPLYFEAFPLKDEIDADLTNMVLSAGADVNFKDEKGRNPLIYLVDRCNEDKYLDVIQYFLDHGVDIAARDDTGATARNVALLTGQTKIVGVIDKHLVNLIRKTDLLRLWHLATEGYDDFFVTYQWRDTYIYAAGNITSDASDFLKTIPEFQQEVKKLQTLIKEKASVERIRDLLEDHPLLQHLLLSKDKGGRCCVTLVILYNCQKDLLEFFLRKCADLVNSQDNLHRTPLHYAYALGDSALEIQDLLLIFGANKDAKDVSGKIPDAYLSLANISADVFIENERQQIYGLEWEMELLEKSESIKKIILSSVIPHRKYIEFLHTIGDIFYPLAAFPRVLEPYSIPLKINFRDVIFIALENGLTDIVKKMVYLGSNCTRQEKFSLKDNTGTPFFKWMNAEQYAKHLGLDEAVAYISENKISAKDIVLIKTVKHRTTRFTNNTL